MPAWYWWLLSLLRSCCRWHCFTASLVPSLPLCSTAETRDGEGGSQRGSGVGRGLLLATGNQAGGTELHMGESLCLMR